MSTSQKITKWPTLKKRVNAWRKQGLKIAFTNGCFDLLHLGHISYLEKAKGSADKLILGLNSDKSVRAIKGRTRPIVFEKGRARVMAALECVDAVTLFDEDTPYDLISYIKPDVLIKGADWKGKGIVGADVVKSYGGQVKFITYVDNFSTTNIIKKIKKHA